MGFPHLNEIDSTLGRLLFFLLGNESIGDGGLAKWRSLPGLIFVIFGHRSLKCYARSAVKARCTASGSLSITHKKLRVAPEGTRRPCSHS